jgi:hypothetical protein
MFTNIEPTAMRFNSRRFHTVEIKVLRNAKRGLDLGQVELGDTVALVTGHDLVTMMPTSTGTQRVRACLHTGTQAPLMFVKRG